MAIQIKICVTLSSKGTDRGYMARVVLQDVAKIYPNGVKAVDGVSLGIADREFVVLVGPSGCGKSTTLRMIAGLEEISSGQILIGERVVNDVPPKDRDIAMVFQNYALYPHMTVYKNMAFGLKLRRVPRAQIDQKVRQAATMLGITDLLERKPKQLSGGQRQRVAVGRAIVREPKAFLFDEPLSNLDAKLRVEMRAELKRLHRRLQTTTVYVTHDQEEAMTLGDRIVVMKDGIVQQVAEPLTIYERPVNRFVAGFIGTPPMNFMTGRIVIDAGHVYFDEGTCRIQLPDRCVSSLAPYDQQPMVLGVRPESLSFRAEESWADKRNSLAVRVSVVEPLGDRMDVYAATKAHEKIVCRVDAHTRLREGQELPLYVDVDHVHVFQPGETGMNVTLLGDQASARVAV
jgi:multiple sugar transport system ATP-binding protein